MLQIIQFRVKAVIPFGPVIILFLSLAVFLVLRILAMHFGVCVGESLCLGISTAILHKAIYAVYGAKETDFLRRNKERST